MSFNLNGLLCFKKIKKPNYNRDQWVTKLNSLHRGSLKVLLQPSSRLTPFTKQNPPNWVSTDLKKVLSK